MSEILSNKANEAASPRIFLLEDDEVVVGVIKNGVGKEKWEFRDSRMIAGAMEALRSFSADIVLLDLNLPDGDGYEICRQMRADSSLAKIPVIILTTKGDIDCRLKGFAAGAQDYVVKPFVMPELLARIRAHLAIKGGRDVLERELVESRLHERVRQDVVDMIVHDLRSPMTTAKLTLELCKESGLLKKSNLEYLQIADTAIDFAMIMVNDLLDLGSGTVSGESSLFNLRELCGRLKKLLSVQYEARKVPLVFDVPNTTAEFCSDPTLVFRVLVNLLANALKFSTSKGKVVVRARETAGGIRMEVVDSGPGISDAEKEAVFLKFYRGHNAQTSGVPGQGIGLAFCRMAAKTLRGRIWIEDGEGGGSRFIMELPSLPPGEKLAIQLENK